MELVEPIVYSVQAFNELVNQALDEHIGTVLVEGEITGFRVNRQQWVTFDLKDASSIVNCFASVYKIGTAFENGMMVRVLAKPRIYVPYGKYSLTIEAIRPVGSGAIQKAYALLVQTLTAEGLFAPEHKKPLPSFPERVGIITSPEGEALHDVRKIFSSRWGGFSAHLYPVHVQGTRSPDNIVTAIHYFNERHPVDVIILTRGGGSAEDLLAFNDEGVARAIFASRIPVIAAIGHERDVTIAELVADVRAATPSHAAQIAVPDRKTIKSNLIQLALTIRNLIQQRMTINRQHLTDATLGINQAFKRSLLEARSACISQDALLNALNPIRILDRGYSFTMLPDSGTIIRSITDVSSGQQIRTYLADGNIYSEVAHVTKEII